MNNHSENFSKASTLINEIQPMISKIEQCNATSSDTLNQSHEQHVQQLQEIQRAMENRPKPELPVFEFDYGQIAAHLPKPQPPVLDYAQIAAHLPKPQSPVLDYAQIAAHLPKAESPPSQPPTQPPTNIRKQMKKSSDELQKRNNVMIYGLNVDNCSVKDRVLRMFRECGVEGIRSTADNIVSAHVVSSNKAHPAIRVVMSNQFIVGEILAVARNLKNSGYSHVYISKDRSPEERERHKKCVEEMKKKMRDSPDRRWAIVGGVVIDKGSFER